MKSAKLTNIRHHTLAPAIRYSLSLLATIVLFSASTTAVAQSVEEIPFTRLNITSYRLHSQILGEPILVEIALPWSYDPFNETSYPVMYLTDGMFDFPVAGGNNVKQSIGYAAPLPETITVGVDFFEVGDARDFKRLDYYMPVEAEDENFGLVGGKADQYISFIKYELKPFISTELNVDTDREVFAGHSAGGLLSLYMLFTQPDTFDEYIAASPSIYWADEVIFAYERDYYLSNPMTEKALFMSVGMNEDPYGIVVDYVSRMAKTIRHRHYDNLDFKMKRFRGENHMSVTAPAFAKGARFVLNETD